MKIFIVDQSMKSSTLLNYGLLLIYNSFIQNNFILAEKLSFIPDEI